MKFSSASAATCSGQWAVCHLRARVQQLCQRQYLYLKREPMRMKAEWEDPFWTGPRSLKKAWCSTAHFHKCLQALGWSMRNTNVCSCSLPCWRERQKKTNKQTFRHFYKRKMKDWKNNRAFSITDQHIHIFILLFLYSSYSRGSILMCAI